MAANKKREPVEDVTDENYFCDVLHNIRECAREAHRNPKEHVADTPALSVRFGTSGKGIHPNYQVTARDSNTEDEIVTRFWGHNHDKITKDLDKSFDKDNLSPSPRSYDDVQALLGKLRKPKTGVA